MKKITSFLIILLFICLEIISPVNATSLIYDMDYENESSFEEYTTFYNTNTQKTHSWNLDSKVNYGKMCMEASYSLFNDNGDCPQNHYSYIRKEDCNHYNTFSSNEGFSIKLNLRLSMPPIKSISHEEGVGRTGFIINIRDYEPDFQKEFYFSICGYQTGAIITAIGGNRDQLDQQPVSYFYLQNFNLDKYHEYLFVYDPTNKITVYVDKEMRGSFNLNFIGTRTNETKYYYSDFISFSLVNRSLNAYLDENGFYTAESKAWLEHLKIYEKEKMKYTLYGEDLGEDYKTKTALSNVKRLLGDMGKSDYVNYYPKNSMNKIAFMELMEESWVLAFIGHGGKFSAPNCSVIEVNPNASETVEKYLGSLDLVDTQLDLSDTDLIMFIGCQTSWGTTPSESLCYAAKEKGANLTLAFSEKIDNEDANYFIQLFFTELKNGASYSEALDSALYYVKDGTKKLRNNYSDSSIASAVIV